MYQSHGSVMGLISSPFCVFGTVEFRKKRDIKNSVTFRITATIFENLRNLSESAELHNSIAPFRECIQVLHCGNVLQCSADPLSEMLSLSPMWRTARPNNAFALPQSSTCNMQESDTVTPPKKSYAPLAINQRIYGLTGLFPGFRGNVSQGSFLGPSCDTWLRSPFPFSMAFQGNLRVVSCANLQLLRNLDEILDSGL